MAITTLQIGSWDGTEIRRVADGLEMLPYPAGPAGLPGIWEAGRRLGVTDYFLKWVWEWRRQVCLGFVFQSDV